MHARLTCGNCRSCELLRVPNTPSAHSGIVVGSGLMHTVAVTKYVCTDCGFIAEWVNSEDDLRRLKQQMNGAFESVCINVES